MKTATNATPTEGRGVFGFCSHRAGTLAGLLSWPGLTQFALRIALAVPFWQSGLLKWSGFAQLNETALLLFSEEFRLHLPGGPYGFPAPEAAAFLAGTIEVVAPILLVVGLGTRFVALVLLLMTMVVQLTIPDGWPVHLSWAAMALGLMSWGPGRLSLDHALAKVRPSPWSGQDGAGWQR